jgi:hypothetical protein
MPLVYRAPMRSRRDDVDHGLAVERALTVGSCGIGGRLPQRPSGLEDALALTERAYDERTARRVERFAAVPTGSFVWVRDGDGHYLLGRITGEWRYDDHPDAVAADLVHVRDCAWRRTPVSPMDVPPAVAHTFNRGGRNFQRIHDDAVGPQSQALWSAVRL